MANSLKSFYGGSVQAKKLIWRLKPSPFKGELYIIGFVPFLMSNIDGWSRSWDSCLVFFLWIPHTCNDTVLYFFVLWLHCIIKGHSDLQSHFNVFHCPAVNLYPRNLSLKPWNWYVLNPVDQAEKYGLFFFLLALQKGTRSSLFFTEGKIQSAKTGYGYLQVT